MIKIALLSTTLYLTPTMQNGGDFGVFGIKYTQKITEFIYLKFRCQETNRLNKDPIITARLYADFDF